MVLGITLAPLLSLRVAHGYYGNTPPELTLTPSPVAERALAQAGCRLRMRPGGMDLYASAPAGQIPALVPESAQHVSFQITPTHADFATVTAPDWAGAEPSGCLFFAPDALGAGTLPSSAAKVLPVLRRVSRLRLDHPAPQPPFALTDWRSGCPLLEIPASGLQGDQLEMAAQSLPDGRYHLTGSGQILKDFYLTDQSLPALFAIIELPLAGLTPAPHGTEPVQFVVQFQARKSRWRYVLNSFPGTRDLSAARILSTPLADLFDPPEQQIRNGKSVWVIQSKAPIALLRDPRGQHHFKLHLPAGAQPAPKPLSLPYASPATTRLETSANGPVLWSTQNVTL